jgi:hypothetical protein
MNIIKQEIGSMGKMLKASKLTKIPAEIDPVALAYGLNMATIPEAMLAFKESVAALRAKNWMLAGAKAMWTCIIATAARHQNPKLATQLIFTTEKIIAMAIMRNTKIERITL